MIPLIALPDKHAWPLRIVGIVFDKNGATDAPYQLPCAEAVSCRFIIPVSRYSDLAGCDEALYSGKGPTHRDSRTRPDCHILIIRSKITNYTAFCYCA